MTTSCAKLLSPHETGKFVTERSNHVTIDDAAVEVASAMLAESFVDELFSMASWKTETLHPKTASEESINFIFVMDTLNFCFWPDDENKQFTVTYQGKSHIRYWSMVACLQRAVEEGVPITSAKYMSSVTEEELLKVFRSDNEIEIPMLKERVTALNEAGTLLLNKFNGSFANCVRSCNKDVLLLLDLIVDNFKSFKDETEFEGQGVAFYKRAQILIADIWLCYEGKDLGEFYNIDKLTMFADYRVPQALEYFGILRYSEELKHVLDNLTVLEIGNRYELEIRGCSIEAVERLKKAILSILSERSVNLSTIAPVNAVTVDNYLWVYAKSHSMKMQHLPHHRIRTVYY